MLSSCPEAYLFTIFNNDHNLYHEVFSSFPVSLFHFLCLKISALSIKPPLLTCLLVSLSPFPSFSFSFPPLLFYTFPLTFSFLLLPPTISSPPLLPSSLTCFLPSFLPSFPTYFQQISPLSVHSSNNKPFAMFSTVNRELEVRYIMWEEI